MPGPLDLFDEKLVELLRTIVEECWNSLPSDERGSKEDRIARVFDCAELGERDPEKLKQAALSGGRRARSSHPRDAARCSRPSAALAWAGTHTDSPV